jgi:galacturan 1,4-alpha-galacturonidase
VFISIRDSTAKASLTNLTLRAKSSSKVLPKNTDGIAVGKSTDVRISNITVYNQDDCVTFKPGANFVTVDTVTCTGSHGISIGSLGKDNADSVSNIHVKNAHMIKSSKAAGIKTYPPTNGHGTSTVTNATFSSFKVEDCDYAIQIQSCYPDKSCEGGGAKLSGILFEDFTGMTSKRNDPVTANLNCGKAGGVCDVRVSKYAVKAPSGSGKVLCGSVPKVFGVGCSSGSFG